MGRNPSAKCVLVGLVGAAAGCGRPVSPSARRDQKDPLCLLNERPRGVEPTKGRKEGRKEGGKEGRKEGRMDGWMDGWKKGRKDRRDE